MRRRPVAVAAVLATAALGLAGAQSIAQAGAFTDTCTHGITVDSSGHPAVAYAGATMTAGGTHVHLYLHVTGTGVNHYTLRPC